MMNLYNTPVFNEATSALKSNYGKRLSKIILFGSYARGEQTPESDIDLLIVLNDDKLSAGKEIRYINGFLFNIAFRHNVTISAHPVSGERFETESSFFFNRIKKEGKEL